MFRQQEIYRPVKEQFQGVPFQSPVQWDTEYNRACSIDLGVSPCNDQAGIIEDYTTTKRVPVLPITFHTREAFFQFLERKDVEVAKSFLAQYTDDKDVIIVSAHSSLKGDMGEADHQWKITPNEFAQFILKACPKIKHLKIKFLGCYAGTSYFNERLVAELFKDPNHPIVEVTSIGANEISRFGRRRGTTQLVEDHVDTIRTAARYFKYKKTWVAAILRDAAKKWAQEVKSEEVAIIIAKSKQIEKLCENPQKDFTAEELIEIFALLLNSNEYTAFAFKQIKSILQQDFIDKVPQSFTLLRPLFQDQSVFANPNLPQILFAANHIIKQAQSPLVKDAHLKLLMDFPDQVPEVLRIFEIFNAMPDQARIRNSIDEVMNYIEKYCFKKSPLKNILPVLDFLRWNPLFELQHYKALIKVCSPLDRLGINTLLVNLEMLQKRLKQDVFFKFMEHIHLFKDRLIGLDFSLERNFRTQGMAQFEQQVLQEIAALPPQPKKAKTFHIFRPGTDYKVDARAASMPTDLGKYHRLMSRYDGPDGYMDGAGRICRLPDQNSAYMWPSELERRLEREVWSRIQYGDCKKYNLEYQEVRELHDLVTSDKFVFSSAYYQFKELKKSLKDMPLKQVLATLKATLAQEQARAVADAKKHAQKPAPVVVDDRAQTAQRRKF